MLTYDNFLEEESKTSKKEQGKKKENKKTTTKKNIKKHWEFLKVISLSTDVPVCFSIKVLVFQKKAQIGRNMGKHSVSRELLVCPP